MSVALQVEKTSKRGGRIIHEKDGNVMPPPGFAMPAPGSGTYISIHIKINLIRHTKCVQSFGNLYEKPRYFKFIYKYDPQLYFRTR